MNWVLSCDFGTSNTTAAEIDEEGRIRAIGLQDQGSSMPSAVAITPTGTRVGQHAVNAQITHPDGFEAAPKTLIGQQDVILGGDFVKPVELVQAVYETVRKTALARHNGHEPRELWLTHPVGWAPSQLDVLKTAATNAGFNPQSIRLVPEPIAAATHYATSRSIQPGARVAVFDFGGGTLDIAVLEHAPGHSGGYRVLAYGGDPLLGGRSFDNRLLEWAMQTAREAGHEDLVNRIDNPQTPKELRAKLALNRAVSAAKVELSTHADADIPMSVGELEHVVTITRDEYEQLISSDVERGGKLVRDVLDKVSGPKPEAIYLTGGSSRTPAIARMLHRVTGLIPATFDDPKLVVSEGALRVRPAVNLGKQRPTNAPIPAFGATGGGVQGPLPPGAQRRGELRPAQHQPRPVAGQPGPRPGAPRPNPQAGQRPPMQRPAQQVPQQRPPQQRPPMQRPAQQVPPQRPVQRAPQRPPMQRPPQANPAPRQASPLNAPPIMPGHVRAQQQAARAVTQPPAPQRSAPAPRQATPAPSAPVSRPQTPSSQQSGGRPASAPQPVPGAQQPSRPAAPSSSPQAVSPQSGTAQAASSQPTPSSHTAQTSEQAPKKSKKGLVITLVIVGLILAGIAVAAVVVLTQNNGAEGMSGQLPLTANLALSRVDELASDAGWANLANGVA